MYVSIPMSYIVVSLCEIPRSWDLIHVGNTYFHSCVGFLDPMADLYGMAHKRL
jgi:hypothetical protein